MITSSHDAMHHFLRDQSAGLAETLREVGVIGFPEFATVTELPEGLTAIEPAERRAETVMKYTTSTGDDFIAVFEALGGNSRETVEAKRHSWPRYLAYLHEKHGCPVLLVVVCQDSDTAKWAAEPISLGVAGWPTYIVKPLVIGPEGIPQLASGLITHKQQ